MRSTLLQLILMSPIHVVLLSRRLLFICQHCVALGFNWASRGNSRRTEEEAARLRCVCGPISKYNITYFVYIIQSVCIS